MANGTPWTIVNTNDISLVADPDPEVGSLGRGLAMSSISDNNPTTTCPTLALTVVSAGAGASQRVWYSNFANYSFPIFLTDASNSDGYGVRQNLTGSLSIYRRTGGGTTSTLLAETSGPVITTNAWWHLSFKADATTGECSLEVNGVEVLTATDPTPVSGGTLGMYKTFDRPLSAAISGGHMFIKDLMIWNTQGANNNTHPGSVSVFFQPADSDITLGGWTLSSGTSGTALIGHAGPPVDTDYASANDTPPAAMEFTLDDLPEDITSVRGIISVVRASKIDGGDGNLQVSLSPDGVTYDDGVDRPITPAFTYWHDVSEINPATSTAWTPAEFNGARIKINRTL
jgi:hypothetical protein